MPYDILRGLLEGTRGGVERSATLQADKRKADQERALELLKGVIGGKIQRAQEGAEFYGPGQRQAPEGIMGRIKEGFGISPPQYGQGQGYRRIPEAPGKYEPTTMEEALEFKQRGATAEKGPTVKVVGNSLVRFDPTTGEAIPLYTAKGNKQIKEVGMTGRIIEYDPSTGKVRELYNEFGEPVFDQKPVEKPADRQLQTREEPIRTGTLNGRKVGEFADGTTRYLDTGETVE